MFKYLSKQTVLCAIQSRRYFVQSSCLKEVYCEKNYLFVLSMVIFKNKNQLINFFVDIVSRQHAFEQYLCEAFGCLPCSVQTPNLNSTNIAKIRRNLVRPSRTRTKPQPIPGGIQQLSRRSQRHQDDGVFLPPIPYPVNVVDVSTMDRECEYCD